MKKIITKKRKIPPPQKGIKDQLNAIFNLGKQGFKKLKDVEELLEAIAREIARQLDRQT